MWKLSGWIRLTVFAASHDQLTHENGASIGSRKVGRFWDILGARWVEHSPTSGVRGSLGPWEMFFELFQACHKSPGMSEGERFWYHWHQNAAKSPYRPWWSLKVRYQEISWDCWHQNHDISWRSLKRMAKPPAQCFFSTSIWINGFFHHRCFLGFRILEAKSIKLTARVLVRVFIAPVLDWNGSSPLVVSSNLLV